LGTTLKFPPVQQLRQLFWGGPVDAESHPATLKTLVLGGYPRKLIFSTAVRWS